MAKFSVIAKNDVLKQTNELDNFEIAVEMFRYLTIEMDFPVVQLIHNETGEVLMLRQVDTTITEYVSPVLFADTPTEETVDPDEEYGIDEETAYETLHQECQALFQKLFDIIPKNQTVLRENLSQVYRNMMCAEYDVGTLKYLKKTLEEIAKNY